MRKYKIISSISGDGTELICYASSDAALIWKLDLDLPLSEIRQLDEVTVVDIPPGFVAELEWIGCTFDYRFINEVEVATTIHRVLLAYIDEDAKQSYLYCWIIEDASFVLKESYYDCDKKIIRINEKDTTYSFPSIDEMVDIDEEDRELETP